MKQQILIRKLMLDKKEVAKMPKQKPKYKPMLNLKLRRIACGYTQTALAEKIGVNKQQVSQYEGGWRFPRPHTLERLADALDCEVKDIV